MQLKNRRDRNIKSIQPRLDYGFSFIESLQNSQIVGVEEESNAYVNELRNGQELIAIRAMANNPADEMILEVKENETLRQIKFKPAGGIIAIPLIKKYQVEK